MGRQHQSLRLPSHLYLSPVSTPTPPSYFSSSLLSVKTVYPSAALLYGTSTSAKAVSDKIPGFKTSAAFLTTLRSNLTIELDSTPPSLTNTPDSLRPINMTSSTGSLTAPEPCPPAHASSSSPDSLANIPPLTTVAALDLDSRAEALHIIADTVASQRSLASRSILFHPSMLALYILIFGLVYHYLYHGTRSDFAIIGTTMGGCVMAILVGVRGVTGGYIEEAERVGTWKWLDEGRGGDGIGEVVGDRDEVLLTRFGELGIGAVVVRALRDVPHANGGVDSRGGGTLRKRRQNSGGKHANTTGVIRAFAVKNRYRCKGVGTGLLEEAVKLCQEKGWVGPEFAEEHAHSRKKIPSMFYGWFVQRDRKVRAMLEGVKEEMGVDLGYGKKGKR